MKAKTMSLKIKAMQQYQNDKETSYVTNTGKTGDIKVVSHTEL